MTLSLLTQDLVLISTLKGRWPCIISATEEMPIFGKEVSLNDCQVPLWLWKSLIFWRLKFDLISFLTPSFKTLPNLFPNIFIFKLYLFSTPISNNYLLESFVLSLYIPVFFSPIPAHTQFFCCIFKKTKILINQFPFFTSSLDCPSSNLILL